MFHACGGAYASQSAGKQMLSQKERINLLRRILEGWKNVRLEVFGHKVPKSHCGLSSALTGVDRSEAILQKYAGCTPARDFADFTPPLDCQP
jgi:hypothetical protein